MALGIENALKCVDGLKVLVIDVLDIVDGGVTLKDLPKLFSLMQDIKLLVDSAPAALPEVKDIDPTEAGQITTAAYAAVKVILEKVSKVEIGG